MPETINEQNNIPESAGNSLPWYQTPRARIVGGGVLALLFLGFLVWFFAFRPFLSTDDARISADIVNVANAGASGTIIVVNVKEGDIVTNGQILVELDHRSAQAQFDQAQARYDFAQTSFARIASLSSGAGSVKQQYDMAKSDATVAGANLRLSELALERTYIKSPVNGIVIRRNAVIGNILEMNQVAVTVADIDNAWVSANISEKDIARVKIGQKVDIAIDEGGRMTGRVEDVRRASASVFALIPTDNASGNFIKVTQRIPVKIVLDPHPGRVLRLGESVEIRIRVQ